MPKDSKEKPEKSHSEKPPKWLKTLLDHQTESLKSVINDALSTQNKSNSSPKRRKVQNTSKSKIPKKQSSSQDDDDFDQRFGHLIGPNVNNDTEDEGENDESNSQIDEDHSDS